MLRDPVVVERVQQLEAGPRALHHRDRDGAVECDHRVGSDAFEERVEGEDLWPVGALRAGRLVVDCGDGRLELVGPERRLGKGVGDESQALLYERLVPPFSVLFGRRG